MAKKTITSSSHDIKKAGITHAGYRYQELHAISILLDHFCDPTLYEWVKVEADDPSTLSVDDVISLRKGDGKYELTQVKFTVQPDREELALTWDWLLSGTTGKKTSLLQKWSNGVKKVGISNIHSAKLFTNRIPDEQFLQCLTDQRKIDRGQIPADVLDQINEQLSGEDSEVFFQTFTFQHSQPISDDFAAQLRRRVVPSLSNEEGWLLLCDLVRKWSIHKDRPNPEGKIYHRDIHRVLTKRRQSRIDQNFTVPDGYQPPNESFDIHFKDRLTGGDNVSVIWGQPGHGKSTYLSYLTQWMVDEKIPFVRHHYFLSLKDKSDDRISFQDVANSLIEQIEHKHGEALGSPEASPEAINDALSKCGDYYKVQGKPFVLIVDGLDHVWRSASNIDQMNHLFERIFPLPENVVLLVGTQKIQDDKLPYRLLVECPKENWVKLPSMSEQAVSVWLQQKINTDLIQLPEEPRATSLTELAEAITQKTQGHPLLLIYTIQHVVNSNQVLSAEAIESTPECPDGDIKSYYHSLWVRLSNHAKTALHLISGIGFPWPSLIQLQQFVTDSNIAADLSEIEHLLERTKVGVLPFHESIFAWVRKLQDHDETISSLLPRVEMWLSNDAPQFTKWAWHWIIKSRIGDHHSLLNDTNREWVFNSLCNGYPTDQIIRILTQAEWKALEAEQYARCYELRSLKTRLLNQSYQSDEIHFLEAATIASASDDNVKLHYLDSLETLSPSAFTILKNTGIGNEFPDLQSDIIDILNRRLDRDFDSDNHTIWQEYIETLSALFRLQAANGYVIQDRVIEYVKKSGSQSGLISAIISGALDANLIDDLFQLSATCINEGISLPLTFVGRLIWAAWTDGRDITHFSESDRLASDSLFQCLLLLHGRPATQSPLPPDPSEYFEDIYGYGISDSLVKFYRNAFWGAVFYGISEHPTPSDFLDRPANDDFAWADMAARELITAGEQVGKLLRESPHLVNYASPFQLIANINQPDQNPNRRETRQYLCFQYAMESISFELHSLSFSQGGLAEVSWEVFEYVTSLEIWSEDIWLSEYLNSSVLYFSADAVEHVIYNFESNLNTYITVFNERADTWSKLSYLALIHDLSSIVTEMIKRAYNCILGYGWRKDLRLLSFVSSLEDCSEQSVIDLSDKIRRIAPLIDAICEYTDGDETNHTITYFAELLTKCTPSMVPYLYEHQLTTQEWYDAANAIDLHLKNSDLSAPATIALSMTAFERNERSSLETRAENNETSASDIASELGRLFGNINETRDRSDRKNSDVEKNEPLDIEIQDYKPNEFANLISDLEEQRSYQFENEILKKWIDQWTASTQAAKDALNAISEYYLSDTYSRHSEFLDHVFEVSLRVEGKTKAWPWLVLSHRRNNGWEDYWSGEQSTKNRLDKVASHYPESISNFIKQTAEPQKFYRSLNAGGPVIGHRYWVYLFLKASRNDIVEELISTIIANFENELTDQPISNPKWLEACL